METITYAGYNFAKEIEIFTLQLEHDFFPDALVLRINHKRKLIHLEAHSDNPQFQNWLELLGIDSVDDPDEMHVTFVQPIMFPIASQIEKNYPDYKIRCDLL